jgi:hypothetical protein
VTADDLFNGSVMYPPGVVVVVGSGILTAESLDNKLAMGFCCWLPSSTSRPLLLLLAAAAPAVVVFNNIYYSVLQLETIL